MSIRWHGSTNLVESFYVFLAGYGMGTSQATTFVHLAASLDRSEISIAGTTWFLAQSFGSLVGASSATSVINRALLSNLSSGLDGFSDKASVRYLVSFFFTG